MSSSLFPLFPHSSSLDPSSLPSQSTVSRREFMKLCSVVAVALGMDASMGGVIAHALESKRRPSVVYMHGSECTGCTEALLRTINPYFDVLIMETISLDYCETVMAAAGHAAHNALEAAIAHPEGYYCLIEGAIPTRQGGVYGRVADENMLSLFHRIASGAKAVLSIGSCAAFGGIPAAHPNPSHALSVHQALGQYGINPINIAGCPPNPVNIIGTIVHLLTKGMPDLDYANRPLPFYAHTVHDFCPRRNHFDRGEFALSFASEEARRGWCLYELGCRGPFTYNNCPTKLFNEVSWPVQAGSPCIGCSEPDFWDVLAPLDKDVRGL